MNLLAGLAVSAIGAFLLTVILAIGGQVPRPLLVHLALAAGAMPLIFGAMGHFVPVLCRAGDAPLSIRRLPLLALAAALMLLAAFALPGWWVRGASVAALPALAVALVFLIWIRRSGRLSLGAPHPGLWWYGAACLCLVLALLAVLAMEIVPSWRPGLRLFHLHLNTLGFIGLTALGTLQVLLPTAAERPDPGAAVRLRRDLPLALGGVLLMALGAGLTGQTSLAGLFLGAGFLLWLLPVLRLGRAWWMQFRGAILQRDGAAPSLALALGGLLFISLAGVLHGLGVLEGGRAIAGFFLAFLLPLVTGAVAQLLPVWLRPGPRTPWHGEMRALMGKYAGPRALVFLSAGMGYSLGWDGAALLAAPAMADFVPRIFRVLFSDSGKAP